MRNALQCGVVVLAAGLAVLCPLRGFAQPDSAAIRFVTTIHSHGVDYESARALGAKAFPTLRGLLEDRRSSPYWANVVTTMGAISAPGSYACLRDFISERLRGNVDGVTFRAIRAALPALGLIRSPEQRQVLEYLSEGADPGHWMGLFWSHPNMGKMQASNLLAELCVDGLAYTGTAEADSVLDGLLLREDRTGWVQSIGFARQRNSEIRSLGLVEYLRSKRRH